MFKCKTVPVEPDLSRSAPENSGTYAVTLLYQEAPPDLRSGAWVAALPAQIEATPTGGGLALADLGHTVTYTGQTGPAMSVVMPCASTPDAQTLATALSQTWTWPEAADAVANLHSAVYIGELMGRFMPHQQRLETLLPVISGIVRTTRPAAVLWHPAGYLAEPRQVVDQVRDVLFNVRLFRIEGATPGALLMDTMGLAPLGLPDLQCKARNLEPGRLAAQLKNLAHYLLDAGDVILDGHTVEGTEPGSAWTASRACAIAEPPRQVLDLDPGPQHAV
jgi:hypothetical protein